MSQPSRNRIAAGILAAGGLATVLWMSHRSGPAPTQDQRVGASSAGSPTTDNSESRALPGREPVLISESDYDETARIDDAIVNDDPGTPIPEAMVGGIKQTLAAYEEVMAYPRWSRAADESVPHLLRPNEPIEIGQEFAGDKDRREIRTDLRLDRWYIGPGEAATATLTVTRQDARDEAYEPDSVSFRIEYFDVARNEWPKAADLPMTRSGNTWTAIIDPAKLNKLAITSPSPEVRLIARVEIAEFFKDLPLAFSYQTKSPFTVVSMVADRIVDGSLEVDFEVDAAHLRPVDVQAVLYDASGETPIAYYDWRFEPTKSGRQTMTIQFFGKVLRDKGINGPFRIKNLKGSVIFFEESPAMQPWFHDNEPAMLTSAHQASEFSDKGFESPEKDLMIARYRELIDVGGI